MTVANVVRSSSPATNSAVIEEPSPGAIIRLESVNLFRRSQEEFSFDLKRNIFAIMEGRYRKPSVRQILSDATFTIKAGEKIGIIGANGSGKSTLLKVICGILKPTSGVVEVRGSIAPLIELGAGFDIELSVYDNIMLYGILLGFSKQMLVEKVASILEFSELQEYAAMPVKTLSSGMAARLGFAIATDVEPDVLILDEVLSVGDEHFRHKSKERLGRFWNPKSTVVVVSHELDYIRDSCNRVLCLNEGKIIFDADPESAIAHYMKVVNCSDAASRQ